MNFIFADSHDYIDPEFDFIADTYSPDRRAQHDDVYPHEYFPMPPYDGILVSRATVGDERRGGKYSTAQSFRFRRDGAATYLRYDFRRDPRFRGGRIMGDCGAFSYVKEETPLYSVAETIDFYSECGFTHGVSVDHAILGFREEADCQPSLFPGNIPDEWRRRFDLTLSLAADFRLQCEKRAAEFTPIGVAQGWSPQSYAEAVRRLVRDSGYDYVALGGMVPLKVEQIHRVLEAVRHIAPDVKLHIFGFTKADNIAEFVPYNLESFDSTSPVLRAFKDSTKNYMTHEGWYTAIRVPQSEEFRGFKHDVLAGAKSQRELRRKEAAALEALRRFGDGQTEDIEATLEPVLAYDSERGDMKPGRIAAYRKTLTDRPWTKCQCMICKDIGIETLLFRGSNRNRRRGFHNLWTFHQQLVKVRQEVRRPAAN